MRYTSESRPDVKVRYVERRQQTPETVHLRVVPVDLGSDQEDCAEKDGESEAGYQRVRGLVEVYQAASCLDSLEKLCG